jgi:hypothetical protein
MDLQNNRLLTCPPESLDIGLTAKDITGSATCIEVIVYLTDPSVNVSPVDARSGESGTEIAKDGSITWKKYGTENILDIRLLINLPEAQSTPNTATIWPACAS